LGNLGLGENRQRKLMGKVGVKTTQWNPNLDMLRLTLSGHG